VAGLAHSDGSADGASTLARLALRAAGEAAASGTRVPVCRIAAGPVPLPVEAPDAGAEAGSSLAARFQRLSLLHRMSDLLFSERPFPEALTEACHVALALVGARSVAVRFSADLDAPDDYRHGDGDFAGAEALAEEDEAIRAALDERRLVRLPGRGRWWTAAPLLRVTPQAAVVGGAVAFGLEAPPADPAALDEVLVEAARLLRNARLIRGALHQRKIFEETFEQSGDAILITDLKARTLMWNRSAQELFQWTADEMRGRDARVLVREGGLGEWRRLTARLRRAGHLRGVETSCRRKDGVEVPVEITGAILRDDDGVPFGGVLSYRDVTKRREVERMRDDFVSMVVHEVRTPLTSIGGFAQLLDEDWDAADPAVRARQLRIIRDEASRLSELVTNFLSLQRLETGAAPPVPEDVDVPALLARVAGLFDGHPSKPLFAARTAPGAERLRADPEQVYRLLVNLAGNAVKYSPPGGTVTLSAEPDGDAVLLSVADSGPGVAKADLARLFEKFFRAGDEVARRTPGTGLGLAICKDIAEAHGGRIWAESGPGRGAVFKVRLPKSGPARR
ncbi:MAG: PAS domain S-box protein, partial [Elusimicrobia bacterium]|nr:PAS domain S-box protein [Elusimicrobiota bacterium]